MQITELKSKRQKLLIVNLLCRNRQKSHRKATSTLTELRKPVLDIIKSEVTPSSRWSLRILCFTTGITASSRWSPRLLCITPDITASSRWSPRLLYITPDIVILHGATHLTLISLLRGDVVQLFLISDSAQKVKTIVWHQEAKYGYVQNS